MTKFSDIPQMTQDSPYQVSTSWDYLPQQYASYVVNYKLNVCPEFQRHYVWTDKQKVRYVEYILKGGKSGKDIYFNCPTWQANEDISWFVLVDGKQRLDAVLGFLNNEFSIFDGKFRKDFTDRPKIMIASFNLHINTLKTMDECLQWYLDLNSGGTIHSEEELDRVRELIKANTGYVVPGHEEIMTNANLDREVLSSYVKEALEENARYLNKKPPPTKKVKKK